MKVIFEKITDTAIVPNYAHTTDAGLDLYSDEELIIKPNERRLVGTGIKVQLPTNTEGQVRSKSGLALKFGIMVLNSPGTIDSGYRGEIKVILYNTSDTEYKVNKGEKIAQLVICPYIHAEVSEGSVDVADRGEGGFGSTGLK